MKVDPRCRIEMLGPLRVVQAHQTLTRFATQKAAALLAYLALRPGPHSREQIIDLFWPEMDLPAGRSNLSTTLSSLRRQLEPTGVPRGSVFVTSHAQAGLNPAAVTTDVADFERLCGDAEAAARPESAADLLERAAAVYQGDFQPGNYQDWAVRESERLHARLVAALDHLGQTLEVMGRFAEAAETARRRVAADPYTEEAHAALVRRLVQAGQHTGAREAAHSFEQFFRREFGSGLSPAMSRTLESLLGARGTGQPAARAVTSLPPAPKPKASPPACQEPSHAAQELPAASVAPIPFWLSRFFGRTAELERLAGLLLPPKSVPALTDLPPRPCRLATLVGPGGAGKTRLAAEFARQASGTFGCWCGFVPLADLVSPNQIFAHIAQSLGLPPSQPFEDQIAAFFRMRDGLSAPPVLLILDNIEQLLRVEGAPDGEMPASEIVRALLERSPRLSVLCTSRQPLGVQGEQVLPVGPLPVPEIAKPGAGAVFPGQPETLPETLASVSSVRLYLDRAQAVRPDFGLTAVNAPAVAALCRALEGSPLALELAASWVRLLPPRKMWERLEQGLGVPEGRHMDLPARQRSLSAALDWSWRLLAKPQQRLLARLSVFRGGWSLEAAERVCEEPEALGLLADLGEASLVEAIETSGEMVRYRLLEMVREFSLQKLQEQGQWESLRERQAAFFGAKAAQAEPNLRGPEQKTWLDALEAELDNLRASLDWHAAALGHSEDGLRLVSALAPFWRARGYLREGYDRCRALLSRHDAADCTSARADALNAAGELATLLTAYDEAENFHEEALSLARQGGYVPGEADALLGLGTVHYWYRDFPAATRFFGESLALRQERGEAWAGQSHKLWGEAATYHSLGNLAMRQAEYTEALSFFERALALRRCQGDALGVAGTLGALGQAALADENYDEAAHHAVEAMQLFNAAGQRWTVALCLTLLSQIAQTQGKTARSVRLLGSAAALRERFHFPFPPAERAGQEEREKLLRARLGTAAFQAAWAEGWTLSWEQTVALAQAA